MQCRGQVEGGVAQAIGAALYEDLTFDADGKVANPTFRGYHIPAFADMPGTEVHFADTYDQIGPLGAKSMSESPYNPIAAALGNAIRDATGVRLYETPVYGRSTVSGFGRLRSVGVHADVSMLERRFLAINVGLETDAPACLTPSLSTWETAAPGASHPCASR